MCSFDNWRKRLKRRAAARRGAGTAVLAALITGCSTLGEAPETTSSRDPFEAGKCFGLDRNISYFAERSSQSGIPVWEHGFTFANSFNFAPATRDARQIAHASATFDSTARKLTIKFSSSDNRLIQEVSIPAAEIRECNENQTEIYFPRSTSGDGARVGDRITVKISRFGSFARVTTEIDRTQYIVFVPFKRSITYVAEFGVRDAGH